MKDKKNQVIVAAVVLIALAAVSAYYVYNYGYKRGYVAGANNQLLCAAAQRDASLKPLCK